VIPAQVGGDPGLALLAACVAFAFVFLGAFLAWLWIRPSGVAG
jgi:hypothetical protein